MNEVCVAILAAIRKSFLPNVDEIVSIQVMVCDSVFEENSRVLRTMWSAALCDFLHLIIAFTSKCAVLICAETPVKAINYT